MTIKRCYLAIAVILFSLSGLMAQEKELSLDDCIKIGLEKNINLHSSKQKVLGAEYKLKGANAQLLPSLKLSAGYTRLSSIDPFTITIPPKYQVSISPNITDNYSLKFTVQQPLFTGFRLSGNSNLSENLYQASVQDLSKDQIEFLLNIKTAYWNLFKVIKLKEAIDKNVMQIQAHIQDIQNLFKQGMATKNDLLKVQVQLSDAQIRQLDAANNIKMAELNLNNIIQLPLSVKPKIDTSISKEDIYIKEVDYYLDEAAKSRPELKAFDFRIKAGESAVTVAKSGWYPQVFLFGDYNYANPNQRVFPQQDKFKGTWDVGINLSWDIWNWGQAGHQSGEASAQLEQTKDQLKSIRDLVTLEVTQNYLTMLQNKEKITAAGNSVAQAEENYRLTADKFKEGLALNSDLLDAETALLQSNTNYIQSVADFNIAKAKLEKAIGK